MTAVLSDVDLEALLVALVACACVASHARARLGVGCDHHAGACESPASVIVETGVRCGCDPGGGVREPMCSDCAVTVKVVAGLVKCRACGRRTPYAQVVEVL